MSSKRLFAGRLFGGRLFAGALFRGVDSGEASYPIDLQCNVTLSRQATLTVDARLSAAIQVEVSRDALFSVHTSERQP
jgi:hypothetical protein